MFLHDLTPAYLCRAISLHHACLLPSDLILHCPSSASLNLSPESCYSLAACPWHILTRAFPPPLLTLIHFSTFLHICLDVIHPLLELKSTSMLLQDKSIITFAFQILVVITVSNWGTWPHRPLDQRLRWQEFHLSCAITILVFFCCFNTLSQTWLLKWCELIIL